MKIIGHRGAKGLAPENTLASLAKAIEHGVDEVEFDVRVTKDGIPVLSHDAELIINQNVFKIAHYTYHELREVKEYLPTLKEALDFIDARTAVLLELKASEPVEPVIVELRRQLKAGHYGPHNLSFASFNQRILRAVHAALPELTMVVNERWSGVRGTYRARQLHTKRINMNQRWLWRGFIAQMAKGGYQLAAYTLNDVSKANRWQTVGLYAAITDFPDEFTGK